MWFDSSAKPENQKPIIFEDITYNFKTNNGKIICEEIQNKTKKRHLICESVIKEANPMALTNALIHSFGKLGNVIFKNGTITRSQAKALAKLGISIEEGTPCQEALETIKNAKNDGKVDKKACLSVFVKEQDIKFIDGTIRDDQDFDEEKASEAGNNRYSYDEQHAAIHSKSTSKQVKSAKEYAKAAINKTNPDKPIQDNSTGKPSEPIKDNDADKPAEPIKGNDTDKPAEPIKGNDTDKPASSNGFKDKWNDPKNKGFLGKAKLLLVTIFNFIAKIVALIIAAIIFCILLIWKLIKKIWTTSNLNTS